MKVQVSKEAREHLVEYEIQSIERIFFIMILIGTIASVAGVIL